MTEERITSRKNPFLQQVRKLVSSRKAREESGLFVSDGTKLLAEAVRWYPGLHTVILSDGVEADVPDYVRVVRVPGDVMESISPMETPQGALFLCRLPHQKIQKGALTQVQGSAPRRSAIHIVHLRGTAVKSANIRQSRDKFASWALPQIAKTIFIIYYLRWNVKNFCDKDINKFVGLNKSFWNKLHNRMWVRAILVKKSI